MTRDRAHVALNLENDRLTAVAATVKSSRVQVRAWVSALRPADVDPSDPAALGRWVGEELKKGGLLRVARRGGVVFAVPRGEVVLKRITLPPGAQEVELPAMVRLQMMRQLTVSPESAAIDFVPIGFAPATAHPGNGKAAGPLAANVLAGALQGDRLGWRKAVCRGAGMKLRRVALRSAGAAALLAEAAQRRGGSTMGIALGSGSTEFVVVEDGQLAFARATDLFRPDRGEEHESFAQRVAVEAKRTWMSYRASAESTEIEAVIVLGRDDVARLVADRCREGLGLVSEAADYPGLVEAPAAMTSSQRAEIAPLVGLLAEPVMGRPGLDFANPRKAPDLAAAKRQRALLAALGIIVVGGAAMTMGRMQLRGDQAALARLQEQWTVSNVEYADFLRLKAQVEHIERWKSLRVDWLAHLNELVERLPDAREGHLDRLAAQSGGDVMFTLPRGKRWYGDGSWSQAAQAAFDLVGTVKRRETADALRLALVSDPDYRVESRGQDTPTQFNLRLLTSRLRPAGPAAAGRTNGGGS